MDDGIDRYDARFGLTPAQYHAGLDKLWSALGVTGVQQQDVFTMSSLEILRLRDKLSSIPRAVHASLDAIQQEIMQLRIGATRDTVCALSSLEHLITLEKLRVSQDYMKSVSTTGGCGE